MNERDRIRWLLRPLGEPAFLRLYYETEIGSGNRLQPRHPWRLFEQTFWSLPADPEHPEDARRPAWDSVCAWLGKESRSALDWYCALVHGLREHEPPNDVRDLARFWAAPELFVESTESTESQPLSGYHEIHCHLRGAVPFLHMWSSWLNDDRARALLRTYECKAGSWKKTWAELVSEAARIWHQQLTIGNKPIARHPAHTPEHLHDIVAALMRGRQKKAVYCAAGRYLAIYTAARRYFLFQRGKAGLVRFSDAYDRYSKVQKRRGRRNFDQTRHDVAAIMQRFEQEGAVAVELRPTMDTRRAPFQAKLQSIVLGYFKYLHERASDGSEPVLMGLVPSLYKQEACGKREDDGTGRMWDTQARVWNRQLDMLFAMLDDIPALRFFIVGVDAAGRERGCPPRMLAPLMQRVRQYGRDRGVGAARPGRAVSPCWLARHACEANSARDAFERLDRGPVPFIRLGRTVHAGEDFIDPMTGLRHIWETLDACDFGPGDRLGHALAASLVPEDVRALLKRRATEAGEITATGKDAWQLRKPRGVHALDLAWLASMDQGDRQARWQAELGSVSASLLGVPAGADRLARHLHAGLHLPMLPAARFLDPDSVADPDCTWHRMDKPWLDAFERMRTRVLAEIRHRDVVIESCPSSNLAVTGLREPPIKRFLEKDMTCAVATDDPGLLDAWPRRELGHDCLKDRTDKILAQNRQASFITRYVARL